MAAVPKCAFCGCTAIDCLAQSPDTNEYLCNGKGGATQSHLIQFLKKLHFNQIRLPSQNKFADVNLECFFCHSKNIFQIGFVRFENTPQVFICCRNPCQFSAEISQFGPHTFTPLVSKGQVLEDVIRVPRPEEFSRVSLADTLPILGKYSSIPLGNQEEGLSPAKVTYTDAIDFSNIMCQFIASERNASHELEKARKFGDMKFEWISKFEVQFLARAPLLKILTPGSTVQFQIQSTQQNGKVRHIGRDRVVLVVFREESPFAGMEHGITVSAVLGDLTFERQEKALQIFASDKKCTHYIIREAILGNIKHLPKHNRVKDREIKLHQPGHPFPILNESQIKACRAALSQRFTLIQGPPGTGKTTVIAAIAASFVKADITPVLVLTQTNVAANFATRRISQTGVSVVRVLSASRSEVEEDAMEGDFDVTPYTTRRIVSRINADDYQRLSGSDNPEDKKRLRELEKLVIDGADVVCTTSGSAGGARLAGVEFKVVIFDESGQCLDPDIVIGAVHGAEQMILVGDHRQLGPVVLSRAAVRARYDVSLMQRLTSLGVKPSILKTQYRMHPAISAFPSEAFYMRLIKSGVSEAERTWPRPVLQWPNPAAPIMFWNVAASEQSDESAVSFINTEEAMCVAQAIDLMARNGVKGSDIGIITPYAGQQMYLIDTLPNHCDFADDELINDIEIASVDAFQGREKNFIIYSCVRANDQHDIGFMRDYRRMCVSITRARYGLIIVGNANTFATDPVWCKLVEHVQKIGAFVEGDICNLKPSAFTALAADEPYDDDEEVDGYVSNFSIV